MAKKEIACSINAACGNPAYHDMDRTDKPVKVAVVGGGPAGMEAARIATERGHLVTLFEKHADLFPVRDQGGVLFRTRAPLRFHGQSGAVCPHHPRHHKAFPDS